MSLLRKDHIGLPARQKFGAGGKPFDYRTLHPALKVGVSILLYVPYYRHLPHPLGWGLWINQRNGCFNPSLDRTQ